MAYVIQKYSVPSEIGTAGDIIKLKEPIIFKPAPTIVGLVNVGSEPVVYNKPKGTFEEVVPLGLILIAESEEVPEPTEVIAKRSIGASKVPAVVWAPDGKLCLTDTCSNVLVELLIGVKPNLKFERLLYEVPIRLALSGWKNLSSATPLPRSPLVSPLKLNVALI